MLIPLHADLCLCDLNADVRPVANYNSWIESPISRRCCLCKIRDAKPYLVNTKVTTLPMPQPIIATCEDFKSTAFVCE